MKKRYIVLFVFIACLPVLIFGGLLLYPVLDGYGVFENYSGWKKVEIPADCELVATVKIPDEWSFVDENNRIYIKDKEGNIIASELYEDWRIDVYIGGVYCTNEADLDKNTDLDDELLDLGSYELYKGASSSCFLYQINSGSSAKYALRFQIMTDSSVEGTYTLFMVFQDGYNDMEIFEKIQKSYIFGGHVE